MMDEKRRKLKKGERVAYFSTLLNLLISMIKALVGFLSGSVVLLTDGIHSLADSLTDFASWFGLRLAQREPTEKFPYGYYKAETLTSLFISMLIIYAGVELLIESYSKILISPTITFQLLAISVPLISILQSFFVYRYQEKIGKEINSQSLQTLAKETKMDIFTSFLVFIGVVCSILKIGYVEGVAGFLLSLLIIKIGLESGKDSLLSLMDVSPSKEIERKIEKIAKGIKGVKRVKELKLRRAGPFILGEVKVGVSGYLDVKRAHEIADRIEEKVKKEIAQIDSLTVHIEPYKKKRVKVAIPVEERKGWDSKLIEHFGRANYFAFLILEGKRIRKFEIKKNPFKTKKVRAGLATARGMLKEKVDIVILKKIGAISFHTLRDNFIEIYYTDRKKLKEILNEFIEGKCRILEKPTRKKK